MKTIHQQHQKNFEALTVNLIIKDNSNYSNTAERLTMLIVDRFDTKTRQNDHLTLWEHTIRHSKVAAHTRYPNSATDVLLVQQSLTRWQCSLLRNNCTTLEMHSHKKQICTANVSSAVNNKRSKPSSTVFNWTSYVSHKTVKKLFRCLLIITHNDKTQNMQTA